MSRAADRPARAMNTRWFQDRLADKKLSQRGFAKLIGADPSAVTRMLHNERDMQMSEAVAFASIVNVPLEDVLVNAGLRPPASSLKSVPVVGHIDALGDVHAGPIEAPRRVPAPPETPAGSVALRFRTGMTSADMVDGWIVYYAEDVARVPPEAIGRLCVALLSGNAGGKVGFVRRGYSKGTYTLIPWAPGAAPIEGVMLERAMPVLWIRTGV